MPIIQHFGNSTWIALTGNERARREVLDLKARYSISPFLAKTAPLCCSSHEETAVAVSGKVLKRVETANE